jgi:hypothetical protein
MDEISISNRSAEKKIDDDATRHLEILIIVVVVNARLQRWCD